MTIVKGRRIKEVYQPRRQKMNEVLTVLPFLLLLGLMLYFGLGGFPDTDDA